MPADKKLRTTVRRMGRPRKRITKVRDPGFFAGRLFDVWFYPVGKKKLREKISITQNWRDWEGAMAKNKLDALVLEHFDCLADATFARIKITSRPDEIVVYELRWMQ